MKMEIYLSLLSGLVGTLIGGFITWITTRYTLSRQFKEERKKLISQERKSELIALNSVKKEIDFNLIEFSNIEKLLKENGLDFIDFKANSFLSILKKEKWDKHSDVIEMIDEIEFLGRLQAFYMNISHEITKQVTNLDRVRKGIENGLSLSNDIETYLDKCKKER
ncbi:hypothetical protein ACQKNX_07890 [Lysinibacillus sp. NPDC093712]|uniref:hypothetical protein n=1 Tax=Lysinibacillus sp. NPDC093712 TaxID=3390579 RepID=UPI003D00AD93